jgi:hypothetical protein
MMRNRFAMAWVVSQLNERFDVSAFLVARSGQVRLNPEAADRGA